ncbi:lactose permease [Plectosphaerella plurivora]|uniref:Lactose permease n=1 Tax=Plectosphaerella plurivora TaxID=936078 RepID=A0A9P9A7M0_9PEZI|nr:lactose permease [Plectosphaerella plurivora]
MSPFKNEKETAMHVEAGANDTNHTPKENPDPWYKQTELRKLYISLGFLFLASSTLGYDGSLLNGLQTMNTWQMFFDHPTGARLGLYSAIPGLGGILALPVAPYIADGLGRKKGTAFGCLCIVIGALIQALVREDASARDGMFYAGRVIMGFGSNIANGTCPLLITEYNTIWYLGAIIAAWTCFGTLENLSGETQWRLPLGLQCLMPGTLLFTVWLVPESPRWLISKEKYEQANKVLTKYHGNGNEDDEFVRWEFAEITNTLRHEREAASSNGWMELVRTKGNRKRCYLIIATAIFSQCSGNGLVSYYLSVILGTIGIRDSKTQALLNGGLMIWCWLISLVSAFFVDRLGRRFLFLFAGVGMLLTFSVWTACSAVYAQNGSSAAGVVVVVMIFLFYGVAGAAWPGLTVSYTVEILPYNIRAKGLMLCFFWTSCAGVFNQWVNPLGLEALQWRFYFVYIAILVIECLVIYFFFVETRGPTLEEIAILFDGEDSPAGVASAQAQAKIMSGDDKETRQ